MTSALASSQLSLHQASYRPELRLALVHDDRRDPDALVAILSGCGLPPDGGILPLRDIGKLTAARLEALVLATDFDRVEALAGLRALCREVRGAHIVVVARDTRGVVARLSLNAGAAAFVPEQDVARSLAPAVRAVTAGLVCVPREMRRLVAKPTFSHREKQVLQLVVIGLTNRQIAGRLYLAESTIKSHLASAFAKLGVRSRKDAAALLLDQDEGLVATALPLSPLPESRHDGRAGIGGQA
jgi:DNA-binding NarL/FixJ family response regulator